MGAPSVCGVKPFSLQGSPLSARWRLPEDELSGNNQSWDEVCRDRVSHPRGGRRLEGVAGGAPPSVPPTSVPGAPRRWVLECKPLCPHSFSVSAGACVSLFTCAGAPFHR